jgi:type I restriction enzyme S subunit
MLLSAKNGRDGLFDFDNVDYISEENYLKSIQRCKAEKGNILIVSVGATIGRSAILKEEKQFALVRSVALIKPCNTEMSSYLNFVFDSAILQKDIAERSWGTAQPCLYLNQIKELTIPLPPLSEQKRIVAEIEKQCAKTKQLKEHILAN